MPRTLRMSVALVLGLASALAASKVGHARTPVRPSVAAFGDQNRASSDRLTRVRTLLDQYCVTCHNDVQKTAGLVLSALDVTEIGMHAETWEKVVRKIRTGAMPPAGVRRPSRADYDLLASTLEDVLGRSADALRSAGRSSVARLNRAEYSNAVRDLLAVDIDTQSLLPADDSGYGFDNIADVLSMSPALLERYISAADKISRLAIGNEALRPRVETYSMRSDYRQDARMGEEFPFGTRGGLTIRHFFPADGEYLLKIRLQRQANKQVGPIRGITERQTIQVRLDGQRLAQFVIGGPGSDKKAADNSEDEKADDALDVRFAAKTGTREVTVTFVQKSPLLETLTPPVPVRNYAYTYSLETQMGIDHILIDGPYNVIRGGDTPSRDRIFVCYPQGSADADGCARTIVRTLAKRAYRRPVEESDVAPLLEFYRRGNAKAGFDEGIRLALTRILVSPHFLFRVERPPAVNARTAEISDLELASRLSFFLWSSIPDDELIDVAARRQLRAPAVLERQVRRMLADRRSSALVANFVGQWLYLRNMQLVTPDAKLFPDFDGNLRDALQRETELFFESQLKEDHSVPELLTANYTFLNERLARHYGIPGVYGSHFRRVTYPDDRRTGLLGHGSLLTATSYPDRTSPVSRGKWVLENILGSPPPPPPPNVPALEDSAKGMAARTIRERMEQHRRNPVCAGCHARMDPIGFALENFDAVGRWRTTDGGNPIDTSGTLADGSKFTGPAELRRLLAGHQREFVITVVEKMLTYALGRGVEYRDMPAVRTIERGAAAHDYRWSSIVLGIVRSVPFQMRRPM
jgi:mono/diheme cytochrome c family protein